MRPLYSGKGKRSESFFSRGGKIKATDTSISLTEEGKKEDLERGEEAKPPLSQLKGEGRRRVYLLYLRTLEESHKTKKRRSA